MDLIVAHKRSMRLAELAGLSLAAQTTFATAVSEVARYAMEQGTKPVLILSVLASPKHHSLVAAVEDDQLVVANPLNQGLLYAQRLVEKLEITNAGSGSRITVYYSLPTSRKLNPTRFTDWRFQFTADQPVSAYEEIKHKNEQLKELALRLQDSEQHYKRVTDSLPLMIFTANQLGQLLYANAWVNEFTGATLQLLNQTKWSTVIHPDEQAGFWQHWTQQAVKGLPFTYECRLRQAGADMYQWHLFTAQPIKSDPGKIAAWTGFVVNIDAQKIVGQTLQANQELIQAKANLERYQKELEITVSELNRSNAELTQFAYIASHDLQEPLRKIQTFSDLLVLQYGKNLGAAGTELLSRMQASAGRMQALVKDLLAFSRLTTQTPFKHLNLDKLVAAVISDLEAITQQKQATIKVDLLGDIQGNEIQLRQLFQNLVSNALKYSRPNHPPVIQITATAIAVNDLPVTLVPIAPPYYISIAIEDNGIGFDQKYEDRIFRLFQRLHGRGQYEGTGMGLAICKKVVDNHQGFLQVRSEPGKGSVFTVYLPNFTK
ncbi:PAS domain-containing protein [Spirosoma aureum]|uniref:histidine kinase n=2 Tax=Spirosoma aureum TaxID=2692134 RepID=A0A6G9B087_9BACT|nr:PAS domain-containing protein [Spirosoma aureum]